MSVKTPQPNTATRIGILLIAGLFLSAFITVSVCATPPPPGVRVRYLLPDLGNINSSVRDYLYVTDDPVPVFPNLSPYYAYQNILYKKTGVHYVSEVWDFTDGNEFTTQKAHLITYLASHGTVSNTTLDMTRELSQFSLRQIPVLEYQSTETSGYFVIFSADFYSGQNYYIAYYGLTGSDRLQEHSTLLNMLIMNTVPGTLEYQNYEFNSSAPLPFLNPSALSPSSLQWLTIIFVIVIGVLVFYREKK